MVSASWKTKIIIRIKYYVIPSMFFSFVNHPEPEYLPKFLIDYRIDYLKYFTCDCLDVIRFSHGIIV